jgi:hypothetical protein
MQPPEAMKPSTAKQRIMSRSRSKIMNMSKRKITRKNVAAAEARTARTIVWNAVPKNASCGA